jgi:hypothetical protein
VVIPYQKYLLIVLLFLLVGCPGKRHLLPSKVPEITPQEFTGPSEGWPPQPKGRTNVQLVPSMPLSGALTDLTARQAREVAEANLQMRPLLGSRFLHLSTYQTDPSKEEKTQTSSVTRVTFFSYTNNMAVEALVRDNEVIEVRPRKNYQPPESRKEVDMAVGMAQEDSRLREKVGGMKANAIVTFPDLGQAGHDHRVLYVSFWKGDEDITRYFATVDLTSNQVLDAGQAAGPLHPDERR